MIGEINFKEKNVTIVGAGITGLLSAYFLHKAGFCVKIFEKQNRVGGLIATRKTPFGIAETAAHSFLATPLIENLAQDLGLKLVKAQSKARFILREGKLRRFPLKTSEAYSALRKFLFSRATEKPRNFAEWAKYHANDAAREYLIAPFLLGIFGAKAEEISVEAAFPRIATLAGEKVLDALKRTQQKKEKKTMATFEKGMGSFVAALANYLQKELKKNFVIGKELKSLPVGGNIIITTPAYETAKFFAQKDKKLYQALQKIRYNPFVSATVFLEKKAKIPRGVGVLIPPKEKRKILGILFNSHTFPYRAQKGFHSTTVILGGSLFPEVMKSPDPEIKKIIEEEMDFLFGSARYIRHIEISRWEKGIPVYDEAILNLRQTALNSFCSQKGHILFGNYTGRIALRGLIEEAYTLANP